MIFTKIFIQLFVLLITIGFPALLIWLIIFMNKKRTELQKKSDQYLEDIHTIAENSKK